MTMTAYLPALALLTIILLIAYVVCAVTAHVESSPVTPAPVRPSPMSDPNRVYSSIPDSKGTLFEYVPDAEITGRLSTIRRAGGHISSSTPVGGGKYLVHWVPNHAFTPGEIHAWN